MIIYGTKAESIKSGKIINVQCPKCDENTSMNYSVFAKYAHLYWIPFIPYKKVSITECDYCKKTFESGELPQNIVKKLNQDFEYLKTELENYLREVVISDKPIQNPAKFDFLFW
mgnify:CR=1 FL=1